MAIKLYRKYKSQDEQDTYLVPIVDLTDVTFQETICKAVSVQKPEDEFFVYDQSNGKILSRYINGTPVTP